MRSFYTLLLTAVGIYLLLAVLLYLFQNRMVFLANLPGRALVATPQDAGLRFEDVIIATSDGLKLHGWFVPAEQSKATVLFLHGNAGNISHRLDSIEIFHAMGLNTLIFDYRGYGQSEGIPGKQGTYIDAKAAWDHLVNYRGTAPERIIIFGRSLGGAIAAWLASENTAAAVIIESCFSSALEMARRLYPFMPARLITRLKYPVIDYIGRLKSPLLVVHSRDDEIIPFSMGQALFKAATVPKAMLVIPGGHNNGFLLDRDRYMTGLRDFIDGHLNQKFEGAGVL
jgi:fermentation-respiration switch protein FrsA (DUF1100 family)